jgi:hypothetical protein
MTNKISRYDSSINDVPKKINKDIKAMDVKGSLDVLKPREVFSSQIKTKCFK